MKRYSVGFTLFAILSMAVAYTWLEINEFKIHSAELRENFMKTHKDMVRNETRKVIDYIQYTRLFIEDNMKADLKHRTNQAWEIANNIYKNNQHSYSNAQLKKLIKDALRPIRFNEGRGYFFIVSMDGTEEMFPVAPQYEGLNLLSLKDARGNFVIRDEIEVIKKSKEGFVKDYWTKPGSDSTMVYPKTSFIKFFEPLNWYIGCGEYIDNKENDAREEVKKKISATTFGKDGYVFVDSYSGHAVVINSPNFKSGDYVGDLTDPTGKKILEEQRKIAQQPGGGFVDYYWPKPNSSEIAPKTSFVQAIDEWQWVVGAGIYLDEIENMITAEQKKLYTRVTNQILLGLTLLIVIFSIIYLIALRLSARLGNDFRNFTEDLTAAVSTGKTLDKNNYSTADLQLVSDSINQIIIDKSETEKTLIESEARHRTIFENVPVMIALLTHERNYKMGNRQLEKVFKFYESDVISKEKIVQLLTNDPVNEHFMELFSFSDGIFREIEIKTSAGIRRHHWAHFKTSAGEIIMVGYDITEMRHTQLELKALNDMKDKFFSIIAHDLRGPIGSFTAFLELLTDKTQQQSAADTELHLNLLKNNSKSILFLLDNLLYWARSQRGALPFEPSAQDINYLINNNIALFSSSAEEKQIKLSTLIPEGLLARVDPHMFNTILRNLINNALKYTSAGGVVAIMAKANHAWIKVSVTDNGTGMTEETLKKLMNPGIKPVSIKGTKGEKGSGLGLVLCHEFIEKHGSHLTIESAPGKGSSFSFMVPLA
ncbi:MAG: cache domain-containing protein [Lentimicrobium sp.]|nr:cache domain-containing protein [Lentimicrobium sp.]